VKGSRAFRANLLPGDVIVAIDGVPVESADALTEILPRHAGRDAKFAVLRRGEPREIVVSLNSPALP
jgi:S1-C subfamily serine protease